MANNKYEELKIKCQQLEHKVNVLENKKIKLEKALDDVCYELAYREYNNDSSGVQIEYHAQMYRKKYLGELENGK